MCTRYEHGYMHWAFFLCAVTQHRWESPDFSITKNTSGDQVAGRLACLAKIIITTWGSWLGISYNCWWYFFSCVLCPTLILKEKYKFAYCWQNMYFLCAVFYETNMNVLHHWMTWLCYLVPTLERDCLPPFFFKTTGFLGGDAQFLPNQRIGSLKHVFNFSILL